MPRFGILSLLLLTSAVACLIAEPTLIAREHLGAAAVVAALYVGFATYWVIHAARRKK